MKKIIETIETYTRKPYATGLLNYLKEEYKVNGSAFLGGAIVLDKFTKENQEDFEVFGDVKLIEPDLLFIPFSAVNQMLFIFDKEEKFHNHLNKALNHGN